MVDEASGIYVSDGLLRSAAREDSRRCHGPFDAGLSGARGAARRNAETPWHLDRRNGGRRVLDEVFDDLYIRGVQDIHIAVTYGLMRMPEALGAVNPQTTQCT